MCGGHGTAVGTCILRLQGTDWTLCRDNDSTAVLRRGCQQQWSYWNWIGWSSSGQPHHVTREVYDKWGCESQTNVLLLSRKMDPRLLNVNTREFGFVKQAITMNMVSMTITITAHHLSVMGLNVCPDYS